MRSREDRFWAKVDIRSEDECWLWKASVNATGYGQFSVSTSRCVLAHRFAASVKLGDVAGRIVLHKCDTPACVNPAHLRIGTQAENVADMVSKGRQLKGPAKSAVGRLCVPRGERHWAAKLNTESVAEIKRLIANGGISKRAIARRFGVSEGSVRSLERGDSWRSPS